METLYLLNPLHSLEKLKEMAYFLIVYKGKIFVSKKVANIKKTKNDTLRQL